MKNVIYPKPARISNLKELVDMNAADYGDKPLYRYKSGKDILEFTHNQVKDTVYGFGTELDELGILGKNIAVIGDAHPCYMSVYFAASIGGGCAIPLDKELDTKTIAEFLTISKAVALAYTPSFNNKVKEIAENAKDLKYLFPFNPEDGEAEEDISARVIPFSEAVANGKKAMEDGNTAFASCSPKPDDVAAIIFTSGTTGTSKGVMLTQKNLASATNACVECTNFSSESRMVSVLPMNHSYEVTCGHLALSRYGCTAFLNDSIKNVLRNFKNERPDSLILVPLFVETMHKKIWKEIEKKGLTKKVRFVMKLSGALRHVGIDIRRKAFAEILDSLGGELRTIICGGAPLSKTYVKDFDAFGIEIQEGYGITECSPLLAVNRQGEVVAGSVGKAVLGVDIKIDKSEGEETGEILAKGDNVMLGYYENPEATAEVFTDDGYFRTGDIGFIDKKGYIFITGRKKNIIILSNGKNIFPEELEEHLSHREVIGECVVIGRNNGTETVITAVIYPSPEFSEGKTEEEIAQAVQNAVTETNKSLPTFKHIQAHEIRKTEFEKTTTKKIKRFLVK